jgi:hypothetical protein
LLAPSAGWLVIPQTRNLGTGGPLDWQGALLIAPALTAVVAALGEGYAWGRPRRH